MALATLQPASTPTSAPILAMARLRAGGAIDPIAVYRASGYRATQGRGAAAGGEAGRRDRLTACAGALGNLKF